MVAHLVMLLTFGSVFVNFWKGCPKTNLLAKLFIPLEEGIHRPHEIVGHGAHEAALPVDQDRLDPLALQLLYVDLYLPAKKTS